MAFELKPVKPKEKALLALLFGLTRAGKSTCLGTIGRPTVWLHTMHEAHGFDTAIAMAEQLFGDKACIMPVNVQMCEDLDLTHKIFKRPNGVVVGDVLDADQTLDKVQFYLTLSNLPKEVRALVFDSLTDLGAVLEDTRVFERLCTRKDQKTGNEVFDHWKKRGAMERIYQDYIIEPLLRARESGIDCFATCAAKPTYNEQAELIKLEPDLPMFGVIECVAKSFPDVFPVTRENIDGVEHVTFNMGMAVGKDQRQEKKGGSSENKEVELKNRVSIRGRINSLAVKIPPKLQLELLPANFSSLRDNIEVLKEEQGIV